MNKLRSITLAFFFAFLLPIPIFETVNAASFEFDPSNESFPEVCRQSINIFADLTGESSNGADLEINYDPTQVQILDSDPDKAGIQILNGNAYEVYVFSDVNEATGRIRLAAASFNTPLTSRKLYATIEFQSKPGAVFANFQVKVDGFGSTVSLDSNIADSPTNLDLLTSVTNGTYTFVQSACEEDSVPPTHVFVRPEPYSSNNVAQQGVIVRISDAFVGVDIATVVITINGVEYTYNSPGVSYTGTPSEYTFTIVPTSEYPENTAVTVISKASDFAGNTSTSQMIFNIPPGTPISCPVSYVVGERDSTDFCSVREETIVTTIFGKDSVVYQIISEIGTPGAASILLSLAGLLWLIPFINTPFLLSNLLAVYLGRRSSVPWGVIVDNATKKPVAFAVCRIYKSGTLFAVAQTVSDLEGRYGFTVDEGAYRLEVSREGYEKYTFEVVIDSYNRTFGVDVFLNPTDHMSNNGKQAKSFMMRYRAFNRKLAPFMFAAGFALSVIAVLVYQNLFNLIIFLIYVIGFVVLIYSRSRQKRKTSEVIDSMNKLRIPHAIVKIFDIETGKLIDSLVTNENGMFEFLGNPGEYALLVSIRGYTFPSSSQITYDKISDKLLKVTLTRGDNKLKILADPINDSSSYIISGNLKSPFN
jgi:hypothetical protein